MFHLTAPSRPRDFISATQPMPIPLKSLGAAAVLAGAAATPPGTPAIIIRHDRTDAQYVALGSRYPSVVKVGRRMGDGTLIDARWVLTAAHVAAGVMRRTASPAVFLGDREVRIARAYVHPRWVDMGPHDIALLELAEPVNGVIPVAPCRSGGEQGRIAILVGHGATGRGNERARTDDGLKRGATNRIETANETHLIFRFDAPPRGTDLEGIPGPGDSGGPAIIDRDGRSCIAGVSSAGEPGANGPGTYGALDYFTRTSRYTAWLDSVQAGFVEPLPEQRTPHSEPREGSTDVRDQGFGCSRVPDQRTLLHRAPFHSQVSFKVGIVCAPSPPNITITPRESSYAR